MADRLADIPRVELTAWPTPLEPLPRFSEAVGAEVWIKRDDIGSLGLVGNKVRKIEYLAAAAMAEHATTLVTVGAAQSNHVRATASAAARIGLHCVALLGGYAPATPVGNHLLDLLYGADVRFIGGESWAALEAALEPACEDLRARGQRPFPVPMGGSTATGALGLVRGYLELRDQLATAGVAATRVIHASSSGGTQAGLEVGRALLGGGPLIHGVAVVKTSGELDAEIAALATEAAAGIGLTRRWDASDLVLDRGHAGSAYGEPTAESTQAIRLLARTEGILADPVYSGKALAGLIDHVVATGDPGPLVFWHTGGTPALFDPRYGLPLAANGATIDS
ncbi:MAG TPA: pyridoxal-phosphate dependent enzyme [Candidatus Sulfotelmatobacter sp.]|nr:pyridoxal-phosphate dependent enzyme [Candidatus Sulfotelmatobacter sp.]